MNCSGLNSADGGSFSGTSTITFLSTRCRAPGGSVLPPGPGSIDPVGSGDMLPLKECAPNVTAKCVAQTLYPFRLPPALSLVLARSALSATAAMSPFFSA